MKTKTHQIFQGLFLESIETVLCITITLNQTNARFVSIQSWNHCCHFPRECMIALHLPAAQVSNPVVLCTRSGHTYAVPSASGHPQYRGPATSFCASVCRFYPWGFNSLGRKSKEIPSFSPVIPAKPSAQPYPACS